MNSERRDNAGVIAPPPLLFAGSFVLSLLFPLRLPVPLPRVVRGFLGGLLIGSAVSIIAIAFQTMRRAGTSVRPDEPSTALVTEGPFSLSRNPLYGSLTLFYTGLALLTNTLKPLLLLPVLLQVMKKGVIEREERYLERTFGEEYVRYKTEVRRWI